MENVLVEGWWVPLLGSIVTVVLAVVAYGLNRLASYVIKKAKLTEAEQEAMQAILEGMAIAQNEIVRDAKAAAADGKLTKEEVNRAENLAIEHAKTIAKGPAKDLILTWSNTRISSLIKQLLAKFS